MNKLAKILFFLISLFCFFAYTHTSSAQESGWVVDSFDSQILIKKTGEVQITEIIAADFDVSKHGIFRYLPINYRLPNGSWHYTNIEILSVTRNNSNEKFSTSLANDNFVLKIGDKDKTISGPQIYAITYLVTGVLRNSPDSQNLTDEFYWNVTGSDWPVQIGKTRAKVSIENTSFSSLYCYTGVIQSTESDCTKTNLGNQAEFTTGNISRSENFTIAVGYPRGIIPILQVEKQTDPVEVFILWLIGLNVFLIPISPIVTLIILYLLWYKKGRDQNNGKNRSIFFYRSTVVEFTPPDNLRPAEIGILLDQKSDTVDITATIIDLAVRGYITIEEVKTKRSLLPDKTDYTLNKISKKTSLKELIPFEKELLDRLFEDKDTVKISSLKNSFYADLKKIKDTSYKDMTDKGLFVQNPQKVRNKYLITGVILLFVGMALMWWLAISGLIIIIFSRLMPQRSSKGFELYQRVKGYKTFIDQAEKYRQRFFEDKNLFNEVLPYAIMFGLTDKFAKAMKDIGLKPSASNWYTGTRAFNAVVFSQNINAFSQSFSSTAASHPSSSGSSGGGFSGGGFGGGGGGSW